MAEVYRNSILLPKIAPIADSIQPGEEAKAIKALAERVDSTLSQLKDQLNTFEAAGALSVGGVSSSTIISGSNTMYYQTFEDDITTTWRLAGGSKAAITYPNNGKAGGKALRTTNKYVWLESDLNIPFDPARLYRIRTRFRDISGTDRNIAVGVACYGSDGTTYIGSANVCAYQLNDNTDWEVATGYFKDAVGTTIHATPSTTAESPRTLHEDTRYIRPFFVLSDSNDDQTAEIDYISIEVLTETPEIDDLVQNIGGRDVDTVAGTVKSDGEINDNRVNNGSIQAGAVTGGGDPGTGVTKAVILAGTVLADRLVSRSISTAQIGPLSEGGLTINFQATGTNPLLSHAAFQINADGSADFSGEVSASSFTASSATFNASAAVGSQTQISGAAIRFSKDASNYGSISFTLGAGPSFDGNLVISSNKGSGDSYIFLNTDGNGYVQADGLRAAGKNGFFGATPVSKTSVSGPSSMITVSGTGDDANINTNFNRLYTALSNLQSALSTCGLV